MHPAEDAARNAAVVFLSLPGNDELAEVAGRLLGAMREGGVLVDLSTGRWISPASWPRSSRREASPMPMPRWLCTRVAAERGELSVMVGADAATFERIAPYLRCFATDVLHCGPVGCGQIVKLMNNMVLFEIGGAIAEALAIGRDSGVEPECCWRR